MLLCTHASCTGLKWLVCNGAEAVHPASTSQAGCVTCAIEPSHALHAVCMSQYGCSGPDLNQYS
jgi:hypothetical protein